jgi:hypothetical protein
MVPVYRLSVVALLLGRFFVCRWDGCIIMSTGHLGASGIKLVGFIITS